MPYKSKSKSRRSRSRCRSRSKSSKTRSKRGGGVLSWLGIGSNKPDEQQPAEQPKQPESKGWFGNESNALPSPPTIPEKAPSSGLFGSPAAPAPAPAAAPAAGGRRRRRK